MSHELHENVPALTASQSIDADEIDAVHAYGRDVSRIYGEIFERSRTRFDDGPRLIERFEVAIAEVLENGRSRFDAADDAHNELCIAAALLEQPAPDLSRLRYEPALCGTARTIDFLALTAAGERVYVDVKTIRPKMADRWDQFERARREGWLPHSVKVGLYKEWLGGELWHSSFAARARMLEHALELEQKIVDAKIYAGDSQFILALCGDGFRWHVDELEDFVSFYRTGNHRADDPFALAESRYLRENAIVLQRNISRFACLQRRQFDLLRKRLYSNVRPPNEPSFGV